MEGEEVQVACLRGYFAGIGSRWRQHRSMAGDEGLASQDIASEVQIWRSPDSRSPDSIILPMFVWYGIAIFSFFKRDRTEGHIDSRR